MKSSCGHTASRWPPWRAPTPWATSISSAFPLQYELSYTNLLKQLADDFRCNATGPITQIRIWGSWRDNLLPPTQPFFSVGIWTDVPVSPTNVFSRPGTLVCGNFFVPCTYSFFIYTNIAPLYEQFFDPNIPAIIGTDTIIWEYVFDLTNSPCWQTNGNVYWVSVNASGFDTTSSSVGRPARQIGMTTRSSGT